MGYALPTTKDWATALEVRVTDLSATGGSAPGTFEISVANRTSAPFDLSQLTVRAVDASGKTVAELRIWPRQNDWDINDPEDVAFAASVIDDNVSPEAWRHLATAFLEGFDR